MFETVIGYVHSLWWIIPLIIALFLLSKSCVNVGSKELAIMERRYIGKEMAGGRTIALKGEIGIQARVLGPGLHFFFPFIFRARKEKITTIGNNQIGIVEAITGVPIPKGHFLATSVECDTFQDGEKFLKNGGQKGIQIAIIPPGEYRINKRLFDVKLEDITIIDENQIGVVESFDGKPMEHGHVVAKPVDSNFFQDGEAFLKNGGEKGPQVDILPPGKYRINPRLFHVKPEPIKEIKQDKIGLVKAIDGMPIPVGHYMAEPVSCNLFQDGRAFLANGGQKGPQMDYLTPGSYRINRYLFDVEEVDIVDVPSGKIRMVTAMDGAKIEDSRILGKKIDGHSNFEKGYEFIKNGGEKGRQLQHLMPGKYRINKYMFEVSEPEDWKKIDADHIGVVTTLEGKPISDTNNIAAREIPLEVHSNFQDAAAFLEAGGEKGLQIPVLRAGNYAINPWFAEVKEEEIVEVKIGECAVVTSFVGDEYKPEEEEQQFSPDNKVNAKLVKNGCRGIWRDPLGPGKHALNPKTCSYNRIPTTQVVLSWANAVSDANTYDQNLSTITLRTADAFDVNMDVQVMFHIPMDKASAVVADLGSMTDMISQVLEPLVSSYFRNAAQKIKALDLYTEREALAEKAKNQISSVLAHYHIESRDVMITDVILPKEVTEPVNAAAIADQQEKQYIAEQKAQDARKDLEFSRKQADMQEALVESQRGIEIEDNKAKAAVKKAEGQKQAAILTAQGDAETIEIKANAKAHQTKTEGLAEAEVIERKGKAEGTAIEARGTAQATAYKQSQEALGPDYARLQIIEAIAKNGLKIIPENIIIGGSDGGSLVNNFLGISTIEKLTGKPFNELSNTNRTGEPHSTPAKKTKSADSQKG